jgi:hypothetical protein
MEGPKSPKRDSFFSIQSWTSVFHDERASFTLFPGAKKARTVRLQSPKSTILPSKNKKATRQTHTHTQTPKNKERPTHSKFKFQIQITQKRPRGSERCEKDHTATSVVIVTFFLIEYHQLQYYTMKLANNLLTNLYPCTLS